MSDLPVAPYTFQEARGAAANASQAQQQAERNLTDAARTFATSEEKYRIALAKRIVELHAEGTAWSVCGDIARGDPRVATLRRERDIAEGVREALTHAAWRCAADRRTTERLITWSMSRDLAEGNGLTLEPEEPVVFGRRGAA